MAPMHRTPSDLVTVAVKLMEQMIFSVEVYQTMRVICPAFLQGVMVLVTILLVVVGIMAAMDIDTIRQRCLHTVLVCRCAGHGDDVGTDRYRNVLAILVYVAVLVRDCDVRVLVLRGCRDVHGLYRLLDILNGNRFHRTEL